MVAGQMGRSRASFGAFGRHSCSAVVARTELEKQCSQFGNGCFGVRSSVGICLLLQDRRGLQVEVVHLGSILA